ncbi:MAG: hypothetical protein ACK4NY_23335 [Spirosomataceae bacterium]
MKKLIICLLTICHVTVFAQKGKADSVKINPKDNGMVNAVNMMIQTSAYYNGASNFVYNYDMRYKGVEGSYYFIPKWMKGNIIGNNGKVLEKDVMLKYDCYNKEILKLNPKGDSVAVYSAGFILFDEQISYPFIKINQLKTKSGNLVSNTYMMILYKDKSILFKNVSKKIDPASYQGAYSINKQYDSFEDNSEYYFVKNNGDAEKIKLKKGSVLEILGDKEKQIEEFIKSKKLTLKTEDDLIKIAEYYDTLN